MPFRNPVVGGVQLVRNAIQSQNFITGVAGWRLSRNGDFEANAGVFRGDLLVGPVTGAHTSIGSTLPAVLAAHYAVILSSVSQFAILQYDSAANYYYRLVGIEFGTDDYYADGWVIGSTVIELHSFVIPAGTQTNQNYGSNSNSPANGVAFRFRNPAGASPAGTFTIENSLVAVGIGLTDTGTFDVWTPATIHNGFAVFNGGFIDTFTSTDCIVTDKLTAQNQVSGNATITPSGIGVSTSVAVVFPRQMPAGLTYGAVLGVNSAAAGAITDVRYSAITRAGMTVSGTRNAVTAFTVSYMAFGI